MGYCACKNINQLHLSSTRNCNRCLRCNGTTKPLYGNNGTDTKIELKRAFNQIKLKPK